MHLRRYFPSLSDTGVKRDIWHTTDTPPFARLVSAAKRSLACRDLNMRAMIEGPSA
jgi:hypothetical protein